MPTWPALDVRVVSPTAGPLAIDRLAAVLDDFGPTGLEERPAVVRVFFPTDEARAAAQAALRSTFASGDLELTAVDVPDEDWARRSQQDLVPVRVGRLVIVPTRGATPDVAPGEHLLLIEPSMGFGTGHHATTRLCLEALQRIDLGGAGVLDLGTGSGILALAACQCGAREVLGLDDDPQALHSANENLVGNPGLDGVRFAAGDLRSVPLPTADVIAANLTGALLVQAAPLLLRAIRPRGHLILAGLRADEEVDVLRAVAPAVTRWRAEEDGWIGLLLQVPARTDDERPAPATDPPRGIEER